MKKTILTGLTLLFCITVKGQFPDNYGVKIGAGLSNQYWKYKHETFSGLSGWYDDKIGFTGQIFAEKNVSKYYSLRSAIGYIQKGFVDDITLTTAEGEVLPVKNNNVIFHDVFANVSLKIIPLDKNFKPYIFMGLQGDYLVDYRSVIFDFQGEEHELNTDLFDDFNKFTLGAIVGLGISYNELLFLDLEYNPAITKNFESNGLVINDKYFSLTIGLNIKQLIK